MFYTLPKNCFSGESESANLPIIWCPFEPKWFNFKGFMRTYIGGYVRFHFSWVKSGYLFKLCGWVSKNIKIKINWVGPILSGGNPLFFGTHNEGLLDYVLSI